MEACHDLLALIGSRVAEPLFEGFGGEFPCEDVDSRCSGLRRRKLGGVVPEVFLKIMSIDVGPLDDKRACSAIHVLQKRSEVPNLVGRPRLRMREQANLLYEIRCGEREKIEGQSLLGHYRRRSWRSADWTCFIGATRRSTSLRSSSASFRRRAASSAVITGRAVAIVGTSGVLMVLVKCTHADRLRREKTPKRPTSARGARRFGLCTSQFWVTRSSKKCRSHAQHARESVPRKPAALGQHRPDLIQPLLREHRIATRRKEAAELNNHLAVLRKLLNLAVEYKKLTVAPKIRALSIGEQDFDFLSFEETARFVESTPTEWKVMVLMALKTGLRIGELLALKWEDIDLKAGKLIVKRTLWQGQEGSPKGGRRREVPLSVQTVAMLKAHRAVTMLKSPYVFCRADGTHHTHNQLQDLIPRLCKLAGLPKRLTWHDLRHTFASHLVMKGRSLVEVQQLLGHTTIAMTMRYAHLSPDVKRAAVEALDGPAAGFGHQMDIGG